MASYLSPHHGVQRGPPQAEKDTAKRQAERVAAIASAHEEHARVASEADEIRRELSTRMAAWSDAAGKRKGGVNPNARSRLRKLLVTLNEVCVCVGGGAVVRERWRRGWVRAG